MQVPVKLTVMTWRNEHAGNFRAPGGRNTPDWFEKHVPAFYARLKKNMDRASKTVMYTLTHLHSYRCIAVTVRSSWCLSCTMMCFKQAVYQGL